VYILYFRSHFVLNCDFNTTKSTFQLSKLRDHHISNFVNNKQTFHQVCDLWEIFMYLTSYSGFFKVKGVVVLVISSYVFYYMQSNSLMKCLTL